MRRRLAIFVTAASSAIFCSGCFLPMTGKAPDGGSPAPFSMPALELTVSGTHFGPAAPDSGSTASLVTQRDPLSGQVTDSTFRLTAGLSSASAGCEFVFDTFGAAPIAVGQYTISANVTGNTPSGVVYPTSVRVQTPEGGAGCSGTACDGGAFVITSIDAGHVYGYVQATVSADSGAGVASAVCTFWVPVSQYQP